MYRNLIALSGVFAASFALAQDTVAPPRKLDLARKRKVVVIGELKEGKAAPSYSLVGKKGTKLRIQLKDLKGSKAVTYYTITFPNGETFGGKGFDPFLGRLTEDGTYVIDIHVNNMASDGHTGRYRLTVSR